METALEQPKPNYADRPKKLRLYKLRVDRLDASSKFEGKWVCNGSVHGFKAAEEMTPVKLWMSTKQAGSIHKAKEMGEIFAVLDVLDAEKPRFVWASGNREWISRAFLEHPEHDLGSPATDFAGTSVAKDMADAKAPSKSFQGFGAVVQGESRFALNEEDLPF